MDGETSQVKPKDMKKLYLLEVSEYAVANRIPENPALSWWTKIALKRWNRMINEVKSRYWSFTHMFGLEISYSWEEAITIGRKTGTYYWRRSIEKEMAAEGISFKCVNDRPVGHTEIDRHLFLNLKMDFTSKDCYVAGGNLTDPMDNVPTYSSAVYRKLIHILFIIAALYNI